MTMRKTILFTFSIAAAISAMPAAAAAHAQAARLVNFQDLDLGTPSGRAALNRRIATAVESVCGSYAGASIDESRDIDRCRAGARTGIETQFAALQARNARVALNFR
jgi:UrcA family protein